MLVVLAAVLATTKLPVEVTKILPPDVICPLTPTPPLTTITPVVDEVLGAVLLTTTLAEVDTYNPPPEPLGVTPVMVMLAALNTAPVLPKLTAAMLPNAAVDPVKKAPVLPIVTAAMLPNAAVDPVWNEAVLPSVTALTIYELTVSAFTVAPELPIVLAEMFPTEIALALNPPFNINGELIV